MTPDNFAEWLRRQGHHVIRTESSYWYNQGPRAYQAFPYHWLISPTAAELQQVFRTMKAVCLRFSTPLASPVGNVSYHTVYDNPTYDINLLIKKARSDIRRGLKRCEVKPLSFDYLAEAGWTLQSDTLNRQGRNGAFNESSWKQFCHAARGLPGFEAWGAMVHDNLAASLISFHQENCSYFLFQHSHSDYFSACANNVICYAVSTNMLQRPEINTLFYGLHSLDAPASVDEFKFRMGYVPKPVRQRVVFHPRLAPCINRASHRLVQLLLQKNPGHNLLAKTEGMIRFYLEGLKPLDEQTWPACLASRKQEILQSL